MPAASAALGAAALVSIAILPDLSVNELVFARAETSVGYAPLGPDGERQFSFANQLEPGVGISFATHRSTLELTLTPRVYHRVPNLAGTTRPLFLIQGGARHGYALSPRLTWNTLASIQYGEVEYSSARLLTDSPISRPEDGALTTFDVMGGTGFAWTVTPTYVSSLDASVTRTEPLGQADERAYPLTVSTGGDARQRFQLDERSSLTQSTSFRYYSVSANPDWISVPVGFAYQRQLERRTTFGAGLGATVALEVDEAVQVLPTGDVSVERVVHETRTTRLTNRVSAFVSAPYDPFVGGIYPVAGFELALGGAFGVDWTTRLSVYAYSAATEDPVSIDGQDTTVGAEAAAGYQISDEWACEFGIRESSRASHLGVAPFTFTDGETWAFARILFYFTTSDSSTRRQ